MSELTQVMMRYPQVLVNVEVAQKKPLVQLKSLNHRIEQAKEKLGQEGRVLVRYSGTESKARVMVEGPSEDIIRSLAEEIADELKRENEC